MSNPLGIGFILGLIFWGVVILPYVVMLIMSYHARSSIDPEKLINIAERLEQRESTQSRCSESIAASLEAINQRLVEIRDK